MKWKYKLKKWDRFWRLTITWETKIKNKTVYERCVCDCWSEKRINHYHLVNWRTQSCGCLARELTSERNKSIHKKHWMFWTKIYSTFMKARWRCENPHNPSYKNYWWRGIKFLWNNFEDFYNDMNQSLEEHIKQYWKKETTLDRIDVNWDYCKENCRWVTWEEQQSNRRNCKKIKYNWKVFPTIKSFSKYINKPEYIVAQRLSRWWEIKEITTVPIWMNRYQYYKDDQYKPRPMAIQIECNWKIYMSIKDLCGSLWISYWAYSWLISRWSDRITAIKKLLFKKHKINDYKINILN